MGGFFVEVEAIRTDLTEMLKKEQELRAFASTRLLNDRMEPIRGCGEGDERILFENFGAVARVFAQLPKTSRDVIKT